MPSAASALDLRGIRVRRGTREVLRLDALSVAPGETLAVLGPNGAGKSTLLLTAALLLEPTAGEVRILGRSPAEAGRTALRRETATVFQDAALLDMSARENVEVALGLHGVPRGERRARAMHWLERLGVADRSGARPHTLSGGEAQRVSLARAFAVRPRLLFLDEPFASVDTATRAELVGEVRSLLASEGTAALIVTHDHSEAELLAQRALVLVDGAPAQLGAVEELFARPASLEVARFLGYSVVPAALLRPPASGATPASMWALVPPRAVEVLPSAVEGAALTGTVTAVQGALGQGRILVDVGLGGGQGGAAPTVAAELPVPRIRALGLAPGGRVALRVDLDQVAWL
ncbi:MAG: ABC transporter ATP-binding protein [Dehalococcoidia bacterium]